MLKKHFKWDITGRCNLKCKHCLTGDKYKTFTKKELTHEQRLVVIDNLKSGGVHLINLLEGEPLILGEDLLNLTRYCNKINMRLTLNTNGTLLTEEMARNLFDSGSAPHCQPLLFAFC
jgi:MoaA/NifB/PqqE/SkfB family radical SAM enzyme